MNTRMKYGRFTIAGPESMFGISEETAMPSAQNTSAASAIVTTSGRRCEAGKDTP